MVALSEVSSRKHPGFEEGVGVVELKRFFVARRVQRQGIGQLLYATALHHAGLQGFETVFLQTSRK
ncbi:hypothetical protein T484DRAFT_1768234, partial [Baffinella frigidus]